MKNVQIKPILVKQFHGRFVKNVKLKNQAALENTGTSDTCRSLQEHMKYVKITVQHYRCNPQKIHQTTDTHLNETGYMTVKK